MPKNFLLIVEGSVDEQNILGDAFTQYGFHAIVSEEKMNVENIGRFEKFQYESHRNNVVIIQGPRNRIHDFLKFFKEDEMSIEKMFSYTYGFFSGIFLIYDVDHNDCEDVEEMFGRFCDESTGMLLLSSPCIEVLGDTHHERVEAKYCHLKEYKKEVNLLHQGRTKEYIRAHLDEIMLYFLDKNYREFQEANVMEHPKLLVKMVNERNKRFNCQDPENSYVIFRYFSTVVYVCIAFAHDLTREIDNHFMVREFFEKHRCKICDSGK